MSSSGVTCYGDEFEVGQLLEPTHNMVTSREEMHRLFHAFASLPSIWPK